MLCYALISKLKSQRTVLFFLHPESAEFRVQTQLCLIHPTPATSSSSPALRHARALSSPRPLHPLLRETTFPCYLDSRYSCSS